MVATHVDPGKKRNKVAERLIDKMCDSNDESLGNFKLVLISYPRVARKRILALDNGWEDAGEVVSQFAELLKENIYDKEADLTDGSDDEAPRALNDIESWHVLKSVIDIFDLHIARLKNL
jgi:hypothetical protein